MRTKRGAGPRVAAAMAVATASASASAQSESAVATRRVLLEEAQRASAAGDHAHALENAQAAGRIQMTPSLRLFLTEEQAVLGQYARALGSAELCLHELQQAAAAQNRDTIASRCRQLEIAMRAHVGTLTVRAPEPAPPGLQVVIAGEALDAGLIGLPYVVSEGRVVVEASAPGMRAFRQEIAVAAGGTAEVRVQLEPGQAAPAGATSTTSATHTTGGAATPDTPGGGPSAAVAPVRPLEAEHGAGEQHRSLVGPLAVGGLGVVGLGVSAVFFVLRNGAVGNCSQQGDTLHCPTQTDLDHANANLGAAQTYSIAADVALGVGVLAVAGAAVWLVAGGTGDTPHVRAAVSPAPGGAMLSVGGTF